jgi:hypothetical protein
LSFPYDEKPRFTPVPNSTVLFRPTLDISKQKALFHCQPAFCSV